MRDFLAAAAIASAFAVTVVGISLFIVVIGLALISSST